MQSCNSFSQKIRPKLSLTFQYPKQKFNFLKLIEVKFSKKLSIKDQSIETKSTKPCFKSLKISFLRLYKNLKTILSCPDNPGKLWSFNQGDMTWTFLFIYIQLKMIYLSFN